MRSIVEVTIPAASHDLTTLATAKLMLGITGSSLDSLITQLIRQTSNAIMTWCDRVFALETVSERFLPDEYSGWDVPRRGSFKLSRYPVNTITSITIDGDAALSADLYRLNKKNGMMYSLSDQGYPSSWCFGKGIVAVYSGGYALLTDLPYDIERACLVWIKESYTAAGSTASNVKSIEINDVRTIEYFDVSTAEGNSGGSVLQPPSEAALLLGPYRRIAIS